MPIFQRNFSGQHKTLKKTSLLLVAGSDFKSSTCFAQFQKPNFELQDRRSLWSETPPQRGSQSFLRCAFTVKGLHHVGLVEINFAIPKDFMETFISISPARGPFRNFLTSIVAKTTEQRSGCKILSSNAFSAN